MSGDQSYCIFAHVGQCLFSTGKMRERKKWAHKPTQSHALFFACVYFYKTGAAEFRHNYVHDKPLPQAFPSVCSVCVFVFKRDHEMFISITEWVVDRNLINTNCFALVCVCVLFRPHTHTHTWLKRSSRTNKCHRHEARSEPLPKLNKLSTNRYSTKGSFSSSFFFSQRVKPFPQTPYGCYDMLAELTENTTTLCK